MRKPLEVEPVRPREQNADKRDRPTPLERVVPEAQRGGITFWGVSDKNTWLGKGKYPLLYDSLYKRKDSYRKLHAYLLDRAGLE